MNRSKRFAVLAVVAMLSVLTPAHAADLLVGSALTVPTADFEGDPRGESLPAIGFDERQ